MLRQGTTTIEIKSGYGLTVPDERRSPGGRAAASRRRRRSSARTSCRPSTPATSPAYVELVTGPMLAACAPHARWVDVFVERRRLRRGRRPRRARRRRAPPGSGSGCTPPSSGPDPGALLAAEFGAASADHCTHLTDADVDALRDAGVVATLLPAAEFSTRSPYPDARRLLDAGVTVALATDCNPGTAYTTSMPFVRRAGRA